MSERTVSNLHEHALRQVQSSGDLPQTEPPARPARSSLHGSPTMNNPTGRASSGIRGAQSERLRMPLSPGAMSSSPIAMPEPARARPQSPPLPWDLSRVNTAAPIDARPEAGGPDSEPRSMLYTVLELIGYSGANAKARRETLSLIWNLAFNLAQFVIIVTLLAYSSHHESPTKPGLSEWRACERPLGVWDSIWLIRVALGTWLSYWGYKRDRRARALQEQRERTGDIESPIHPTVGMNGRPAPPHRPPPRPMRPGGSPGHTHDASPPTIQPPPLPHSNAYSRLSLLATFMSLAWFLTAHILEYTSVNSCRYSSPHLWWLTFGILCILYLMILEIFLLGLLVFVFGPVIYLLWTVILLCLGRHPLQNPHYIKPEIGKLPKSIVDQIPLVLYIPTPPEDADNPKSPIPVPSPSYSYPPKRSSTAAPPKRRFAFLRKMKGRKDKTKGSTGVSGSSEKDAKPHDKHKRAAANPEKLTWEDNWEPGEYPFVRLEGNRAVCAICLLDFEEPQRTGESTEAEKKSESFAAGPDSAPAQAVQEVRVDEVTQEDRNRLHLDDAGEGAQPLRLLPCGHVFHQTCVDPWLIDVSGRCPTCQRPVELPNGQGKKGQRGPRT